MPVVNIPDIGAVNFPDTMSISDINRAISEEIIPNFQRQQGVAQAEPAGPQPLPVPERGFFGTVGARVGDVAGSIVSGAGGIASGVGGLAGMAGAGFDNPLSRAGRGIREYGESLMSPELQNKKAAFAQALSQAESQGFAAEAATAARELVSNPGLLASMAIEQIPQFLASFGIGRGAVAIGQRVGRTAEAGRRAGVGAAIGSAAGLQGGDIAGQTYEDVLKLPVETMEQSPAYRELLATMSPQEARESLATRAGREAGLMAGGLSAATTAILPGVERAAFSKNLSRSAISRALRVGTGELAGEAIEEGGGQAAQNIAASRADTERDLMRGVGGAAATGAILGGTMGAGVGAISAPPVDLEEARRAELRGAIGEVVGAREPLPAGLLPAPPPAREVQDIETPVGNLSRRQAELYVARMERDRFPEIANVKGWGFDEKLLFINRILDQERRDVEARRQETEEGIIRREIATSPETQRAFASKAIQERVGARPVSVQVILRDLAVAEQQVEQLVSARQDAQRRLGSIESQPVINLVAREAVQAEIDQLDQLIAGREQIRRQLANSIPVTERENVARQNMIENAAPAFEIEKARRDRLIEQQQAEGIQVPSAEGMVTIPAQQDDTRAGASQITDMRYVLNPERDDAGRLIGGEPVVDITPSDEPGSNKVVAFVEREIEGNTFTVPVETTMDQLVQIPIRETARRTQESAASRVGPEQVAGVRAGKGVDPTGSSLSPRRSVDRQGRPQGGETMFSARRMGEQAQEQGETQAEEASPSIEKSRTIIKKYLADLRGKGKQGRLLANSLEKLLNDRRFNADQIYAAFTIDNAILKTIPKDAAYRFNFLEDIIVDNAEAAKATGAKVGDRAQARVIKPTASLPGFIEISLAEDMLPILNETAAHEAFHVLQDYFGAFDKSFNSLLAKSFEDGMTLDQLEPSIKRRLQGLKAPNSDKSYFAVLKEGLGNNPLSVREAQAYAFGALTDAAMRGQKVTGLTAPFQRFFNFVRDTFSRLRSGLRGDGYQTAADLLAGAGARAEGFTQAAPTARDFADPDSASNQASLTDEYSARSVYKRMTDTPKETVKAFKLFRSEPNRPGEIFPLYVEANEAVPIGEWIEATDPYSFTASNGMKYVPALTGDSREIPNDQVRQELIDRGILPPNSKAKTIKAVAYRPGWHAGDLPFSTHIGPKAPDGSRYRATNQVWAEVEMPDDFDWQSVANERARITKSGTPDVKTAHITDQLPLGGFYRYKTNPNMTGNWLISGGMRVNRVLSDDEVKAINDAAGVADLPRMAPSTGGQEFSARKAPAQTQTENFKKWFKDSKVVDAEGEPLVVYHGTRTGGFNEFKPNFRKGEQLGFGMHFASNRDFAQRYAEDDNVARRGKSPQVYDTYLSIQNPLNADSIVYEGTKEFDLASRLAGSKLFTQKSEDGRRGAYMQNAIDSTSPQRAEKLIKEAGYDGVVYRSRIGQRTPYGSTYSGESQSFIVFEPQQIKSATGNRGTFSESQKRIDYSARKAPSYSAQKPSAPPGTAKSFYQTVIKDVDNSSVLDRILSKILDKKGGESIGSAIARTSINQAAPLYNLDKMARAEGYTGLDASKALEMSMSNSGRIAQMLSVGMGKIDPKTGVISLRNDVKPLLQIMKEAGIANNEGMKEQLQAYLAALRERDLRSAGRKGFTNQTIQAVTATIKEAEAKHPEWKKTAAELDKLNQALIDWAMATGLVTKQQARTLKDKFYTPFYREDYEYVTNAVGRELKGGEKALNDLFGNIILNADSIMKAGLKNLATKTAIETMEFVKLAKPNTSDKKNDNTITFKVNGKPTNYDVEDAVLFSALSVMPRQMIGGIYQTMAKMAAFFRDMVTVAPSFIIANLYRGKISAFVQEGQPLTTNTFAGMRDALNASTSLQNFQLQTGFGGLDYGMGARNMAEAFERKLNDQGIIKSLSKGKVIQSMKEAFSKMQELSEASEMAERIKLAENLIKKGMKPQDAYFQGYMLAPYTRKGTGEGWVGQSIQFLMPLVPFLNAKIQTTYRLIENEKGDKQKLWTLGLPQQIFLRGLVVAVFSLMAYGLNLAEDEDEWDKIPNHMKMEYDIIPFMGNYITLPKAFEIGKIFGSLPVFIIDAIRRGEGKDLTEALIEVGKSTFWMNPMPKAVDPIIAAVTNYDFFRGRPLETKGDEALPVQERINRSTTKTGEALSAVVNTVFGNVLSPIKAQALLDGYTGTLGVTIMSGFDSLLAASGAIPGKPAGAFGDPATMPAILANSAGLNRFYRENDMMVSRFVGDFYKIKEMTDQLVRSESLARQSNDFQRLQELRGEEGLPLRMRQTVSAAGTQISEINKRIRMIERQDIDGVSKAEAIQPLIERRDRIAKRVVDQARSLGAF